MHTTPLEDDRANYGNDIDDMVTSWYKQNQGYACGAQVDRIYAERTQAKVSVQIEKTPVDILQLGNKAASNGIKTTSARFLELMMIEFFHRGAAEEVMSECFQ